MKYEVTYQETTMVSRIIEADSEDEADNMFREMIASGEIDFFNAEVIDSDVYISKIL